MTETFNQDIVELEVDMQDENVSEEGLDNAPKEVKLSEAEMLSLQNFFLQLKNLELQVSLVQKDRDTYLTELLNKYKDETYNAVSLDMQRGVLVLTSVDES
jgi:hypothetical protein